MTTAGGARAPRLARWVLALGGVVGTLGEAQSSWAAEPPENCTRTSVNADVHTCTHGTGGPFATRVAIPYPHSGSLLDIQNIDPTHTLYTVLLSEPSETDQWVVSYGSQTAGTFAFYLDLPGSDVFEEPPYEFELRDSFGDPVPIRLEHVVTRCRGYLSWVKVYELPPARYHLVLGGESSDNVLVAVEHLEAFGQNLFVDADGDGFGRSGTPLHSWCGEAEGYSGLDTDCDDEDESIFPDEEGECDLCQGEEPPESCASGTGGIAGDPSGGGGMGGASGDTGGALNAGGNGGGGPSTGGRGESPGDGGSASGDGLAGSSSDGDGNESPVDGAGCSCRLGATPSPGGGPWPALLVFGYLLLRRRGARGGRHIVHPTEVAK